MSKLTKRMEKLALLAGGSFKTVHDRLRIAGRLSQHLKSSHIESYVMARREAGITPRPLAAAEIGLPRSCYGVHVLWQGAPVGMGRIVGDGALNFEIVDIAVDPAHQGKGLGRKIMEALMAWLDTHAFKGSYVSLVADVPELYAKFGFESVRPESEGMARVWK